MIEIDDTPPPRDPKTGIRDEIFDRLKFGQCLKVPPEEVTSVAAALRRWARRNRITDYRIRSARDMPDGFGRVWLLRAPDSDDAG